VAAAEAEIARARLLALAPHGFEEVERGDMLELAVYTDAAGEEAVRGFFPEAEAESVEAGWEDRWRAFHRPARAGGLWIGPPWERAPADEEAVVIEPGRAFGTGAHATTRACIELLARQERGGVLDAGCGSGVISVAAARLGFEPVHAVDLDPVAVEVTRENARGNGVEVDVRLLDVLQDELPVVDLVVANVDLRVVETLLVRGPAPRAITSGYLEGEVPAVTGWAVTDACALEGWAAHALSASPESLRSRAGH
jgi:ribosomal protein L11 methyltransferase